MSSWTRFVRKSNHPADFDMVLIEADEKHAIEIFKFMFKEYDEYFLYYSTPPTIENVEMYTICSGNKDNTEIFTIRVFSVDELQSLSPTIAYRSF